MSLPPSLYIEGVFFASPGQIVHVFPGFIDGDFEDLVCKVGLLIKLFQDKPEKVAAGSIPVGPSMQMKPAWSGTLASTSFEPAHPSAHGNPFNSR
jgi:hypothetical protein